MVNYRFFVASNAKMEVAGSAKAVVNIRWRQSTPKTLDNVVSSTVINSAISRSHMRTNQRWAADESSTLKRDRSPKNTLL